MTDERLAEGAGRRDPFLRFVQALAHLPPDELPELILRTARELGADDVVVYLVDLDQRHLRPFGRDAEPLAVDGTMCGRAYRTELAVRHERDDGRTDLWMPILDSAERLGVLALVGGPRALADDWVWSSFGGLVGETVVSKSGYGDVITTTRRSRELTLAAELRWQSLPPLTFTSSHVQISGILEPAYDIAGDTFDYAVNDDKVHVAILDAMGHGLPASRMANLAVTAYRHARRHDVELDVAVRRIDEALADQFGSNQYVTGQLGTLEVRDGALRIVNAGHPQPLHFRDGRLIGPVPCRPCPPMGLGLVDTTRTEISLEPRDTVLFYTDGVTEARSPEGDDFGVDRLADMVSRALLADVRPAEVLRQVVQSVHAHSAPPLRDDATLVFLRWPGPDPPGRPHA